MDPYDHLVSINYGTKTVQLFRFEPTGKRTLFTELKMPDIVAYEDYSAYSEFCKTITDNIFLDSPNARKAFKL